MFLHVQRVNPTKDYSVRIEFTNGVVKDVDLRSQLYGPIFEPLRDLGLFGQVKVNEETKTVEWPNGADFAPEFLYEIGREVKQIV
ncbi:MAG TPA: DUF2442 domain-containing protein [Thermoanaerobaculia bacterium]|nr:DUF2442 domain-containing protein [Thermoanaerobaculia bacterium]